MSMQFAPTHLDRTFAHVKMDFQEMAKAALVSYLRFVLKENIFSYQFSENNNLYSTNVNAKDKS